MVNVFVFDDYREYLRAFYADQKSRKRGFSFRGFAKTAGLASPNYLKLVIEGNRRITDKSLPQFLKGLRIADDEASYFKALVSFQEAKDHNSRARSHEELVRLKALNLIRVEELRESRMDYLRQWHHMAVRELVTLCDFDACPNWISQKLKNRVSPSQAKESLDLLLRLGLVRVRNGKYTQVDPLLASGNDISNSEVASLIRNIYRRMSEIGMDSMETDPVDLREVSGLSIAVPMSRVNDIKLAIRRFRRELNHCFSSAEKNEAVYYLGIQFFPLTSLKTNS